MKSKISILTVILVVILKFSLVADPVSKSSAENVARNFYYSQSRLAYNDIIIINDFTITNETTTLYYVFNLKNNNGFVIVAADDRVYPVLGYSLTGNYSNSNQPPALIEWMNNYKDQIEYVLNNNLQASREITQNWQIYSSPGSSHSGGYMSQSYVVSPLLGDIAWNQSAGWNDSCPYDTSSQAGNDRTYTGCVSTWAGQIMKYYHHPHRGTGSHSYNHSTYGTLYANFDTIYDWAGMPNTVSNAEIARLLFHIGVGVEMNYGPTGSSSSSYDAVNLLKNNFYYKNTASYVSKSSYSQTAWENLIKGELNNARPIVYRGDGSLGHAFVCDGYDNSTPTKYHMNWGWGGYLNGDFLLTSLNPGTNNFSSNNAAGIGIEPSDSMVPVSNFNSDGHGGCTGQSFYFYDQSPNVPNSWNWSFPGGNPSSSTSENPLITYNNPGSYSVSLTTSNNTGLGNTETKNSYITIYNSVKTPSCTPTTTHTAGYYWYGLYNVTFGNINNSTSMDSIDRGYHDYSCMHNTFLSTSINTDLTLTVGRGGSGDTKVKAFIDYNNDGDFEDQGENILAGTVSGSDYIKHTFTTSIAAPNTLSGNTLLRMRIITDQSTITDACDNPWTGQAEDYGVIFHTVPVIQSFTPAGGMNGTIVTIYGSNFSYITGVQFNSVDALNYTIDSDTQITVTVPLGATTGPISLTNPAGITNSTTNFYMSPPVADFNADTTNVTIGDTVTFTSIATGAITTYSWDFGSGANPATSSIEGSHKVVYSTKGTKTVSFTVTGPNGTDTETKTAYINVKPFAGVTSNIVATDVDYNGDGSDLQITFNKAVDENTIADYRIIVVKSADAATFDLDAANAIILANYTIIAKSGGNVSVKLSSTSKDIDGDLITKGVPYKVFVLSIADGTNSVINSLSVASNEITLHVLADVASNIIIADVGNNGDGSDIEVTFNKASDETTISQYRVIVVKSADASGFDLNAANSVVSANYTTTAKTGNNISTALNSSAKDKDGNLITRGIAYKVFVLSIADGTNSIKNSLSNTSNEITLRVPADLATNINISDIGNNGDGRDIRVTFDKAADETTISQYRVIVVKSADATSFDLDAANAVVTTNYTALAKTGNNISTSLDASAKDKDGNSVAQAIAYKVFVLSIADGTFSIKNSLSAESNEITLQSYADVASNVNVSDIGDNGNGSDMQVTFDKGTDENEISEYRIIIVKSDDTASFGLAAANSVITANYTEVAPTGSNITKTTGSDAKDIDGDLVANDIPYNIYVLSIADGVNATLNSLSGKSNNLTLKNTNSIKSNNREIEDIIIYSSIKNLYINIYDFNKDTKALLIVYNSLGKLIYESSLDKALNIISFENVQDGIYFVKVLTKDGGISKSVYL